MQHTSASGLHIAIQILEGQGFSHLTSRTDFGEEEESMEYHQTTAVVVFLSNLCKFSFNLCFKRWAISEHQGRRCDNHDSCSSGDRKLMEIDWQKSTEKNCA